MYHLNAYHKKGTNFKEIPNTKTTKKLWDDVFAYSIDKAGDSHFVLIKHINKMRPNQY